MIKKLAAAALVGIALGLIAARYLLVGSALSLIPWGITGVLFGLWRLTYRAAVLTGAVYGFLLAFTFMLAGYQGAAPTLSRLPFFAILGLVGAVCGIGLGLIGSFACRKIRRGS
ncbi:MAG: hypothetical protein P4L50_11130 [Anaerolineaceae bacterium]|nr:hypothetical protein [Anaerolineaceae bacterium]